MQGKTKRHTKEKGDSTKKEAAANKSKYIDE